MTVDDYISYSGRSNTGFKMQVNEDYILYNRDDFGGALLSCIADGSGSKDGAFRPGAIVCHQIEKVLKRFYQKKEELFKDNLRFIMEEAAMSANDVLIGFKLGDESERMNYAASISCAMVTPDGRLTFVHAGNTRIYIIRDEKVIQITKDHTEGQKLVDRGVISPEAYYTAIERLQLYNGIGIRPVPDIQTGQMPLKKNDVIIMTTDGIHYSLRSEAFFDILMQTKTMDEAAEMMVGTALDLRNYADNISVNIMWYHGIQ